MRLNIDTTSAESIILKFVKYGNVSGCSGVCDVEVRIAVGPTVLAASRFQAADHTVARAERFSPDSVGHFLGEFH